MLSSVDKKSGYYSADEYVGTRAGSRSLITFNLNTLFSLATDTRGSIDFVLRIMIIYGLDDRRVAFNIAWAALRATYLGQLNIVEELIEILNSVKQSKIAATAIKKLNVHILSLMNETLL